MTPVQKFNQSDSDDSENFYSSSKFSDDYDRSSIGSIPWAEDAIKQNRDDWEEIERVFYDEESIEVLKRDKELCREILEWKRAFPHVRRPSAGQSNALRSKNSEIALEKDSRNSCQTILTESSSENEDDDDTTLTSLIGNKVYLDSARSWCSIKSTTQEVVQQNLTKRIENNLRINSVPIARFINGSTNSKIKSSPWVQKNFEETYTNKKNLPFLLPSSTKTTYQHPRQLNLIKPSNSASFIRMPPIFSVLHDPRIFQRYGANTEEKKPTKIYVAAQQIAPRRQKSTIILPSIQRSFSTESESNNDVTMAKTNPNRSISAISNTGKSSKFGIVNGSRQKIFFDNF